VTNCNATDFGPYTANFIVAKLDGNDANGNGYVIWTSRETTAAEQAQLLDIADHIEGMSPSPTVQPPHSYMATV
jgi:hypothetical protein